MLAARGERRGHHMTTLDSPAEPEGGVMRPLMLKKPSEC
jgi:hypothetical protein